MENDLKELHAKCDLLEKKLMPDPKSQKKEDIEFRKIVEVYDKYEERLNKLIPFEKRVENLFEFFVTNAAEREKTIN